MYKDKLAQVEKILRKMCKNNIDFVDKIPQPLLDYYLEVNEKTPDGSPTCLVKDEGECTLIVPKLHLVSGADNEKIYFGRIADELIRYQRIRLFMFQPKMYLNITNMNYKINDNEFIILQSLLTNEYFENLVPFQTNNYVKNIPYEFAEPIDSQNYLNTNVVEVANQPGVSKDFETMKKICITETRDVYGNADSYWKQLFPKTAKEIVFSREAECGCFLMSMILYDKTGSYQNVQSVKDLLWEAYAEIVKEHAVKIEDILIKQGKMDIVKKMKGGLVDFETMVKSEEYYLTNLDIWALATKMNLPVILFSEKNFKTMVTEVKWLVCGGRHDDSYCFVRSPITVNRNTPPGYQMIRPSLKTSDVKGLSGMIDSAMDGVEEYEKSIISLDTFLEEYSI
jgi:hypothetical protein